MSGQVGFIMLVHTALDRAMQVAKHWAQSNCPVVLHVDSRVSDQDNLKFQAGLKDCANIRFVRRRRCEWGMWSIVDATIDAAQTILSEFPEINHVFLASGSCLPLRPVQDLQTYLAERQDTDFIESVTAPDVSWTVGGLDTERFTLRFPFSWRSQRRLFDGYVDLQRRFKKRRRLPKGIVPHLGSQWWCLSRKTLTAIFEDPDQETYKRFFRRVWIPDESYFQTLVRRHSKTIESRSLTLSKFDHQGKPHVFYNDHLQLLRRSDCFVARKIWPQADKLYDAFLSNDPQITKNAEPNPSKIDKLFAQASLRGKYGRPGLRMQSCFPSRGWENGLTCAPYSILQGFSEMFPGFQGWLEKTVGGRVHGNLFANEYVQFAGQEAIYNGAISNSATLRDYNPKSFLINLIWNTRGERQCFQFSPTDQQSITDFWIWDSNAHISVIQGAWAIPLFHSGRPFEDIRAETARLQAIEAAYLTKLRQNSTKAKVKIWTIAECAEGSMAPLQSLIDELNPHNNRRLTEAPHMVDLVGFGQFLQRLKNAGVNPYLMDDFPAEATMPIVQKTQQTMRGGHGK